MLQRYKAQPAKKRLSNKIIAGFAAFITTGVIAVSGFAAAAPMSNNKTKPNNDDCKKTSMSAQERKDCEQKVAASVHAQQTAHANQGNSFGHGYGGTSVGTNINLQLNNSNNNVIQVIVNIFR